MRFTALLRRTQHALAERVLPNFARPILIARAPHLFARLATPSDPELGLLGEEIAARHLARAGFSIRARRCQTSEAEVDIVARDRTCLVCVEVKTGRIEPCPRPSGMSHDAIEALVRSRWRVGARLSSAQIARLQRAARALARGQATTHRIDLVEVMFDIESRRFRVVHHIDVRRPITESSSYRRGWNGEES